MLSELQEQTELVTRLRRRGVPFFAVPNGGRRHGREAQALVTSGVQAGVPDLVLLVRPWMPPEDLALVAPDLYARAVWGGAAGIGLEMKRSDPRLKPSEEQEEWRRRMAWHGWIWRCAHGWRDAVVQLGRLGVLL